MKQKVVFTNWKQTLIYSIECDLSAEYEADKIVFESLNVKSLLSEVQNSSSAQIYGFYGCAKDIEKEISDAHPDQEPLLFEKSSSEVERWKIILVQNDQVCLPCLILPESFFIKKPIDEKSIELTLFRILQDMTHTVVACLNDNILKEWYKGKNIPFSEQHYTKFTQFKLEYKDDENLETIETSVNNLIPPNFQSWELFPNSNNQQQFLLYHKIQFTDKHKLEFKCQLKNYFINLMLSSVKGDMPNNFDDYLNPDYRTQTIAKILLDQKDDICKQLQLELQDTERKISQKIKVKKPLLQDSQVQEISHFLVAYLKQSIVVKEYLFQLDTSEEFPTTLNSIDLSCTQGEFFEIAGNYRKNLNKKIEWIQDIEIPKMIDQFEKEINTNIIQFQLCKVSAIRETNTENLIRRLTLNQILQFSLDITELQPKQGIFSKVQNYIGKFIGKEHKELFSVEIIDYFTTKYDNYGLLIVQKDQTYNVLLLGKNGSTKTLASLEHFSHPLFLFQKEQTNLFAFNHRTLDCIKLKFDEIWKLKDQMIYYNCQQYILRKAIFLSFDQTFIGLGKCGDVFKWKGNQEEFKRIKCQIQVQDKKNSGPKSQNFKASKNSHKIYLQLEACPSGKRFLLSNHYVIDIYDMNHLLVKSIQLESKFVLFSDDFDCFTLTVQNQQPYFENVTALTIPNVSNRQMIKQINIDIEKQMKVGNPFFDIIRGSQVKYGPVSSFLRESEISKIEIQVNNYQEREQDIVDYLNRMQIQETCTIDFQNKLIPQNLEFKEIKSFLQFTYTRVPLQLCTIENNSLTPLIDGFRQTLDSNQSLTVPQRAKLLKLGYIEDYLMSLNEKIYVISIIGRQSSGKSYLLNRLFGTRFTVAASRCTDGIWASIVEMKETKFLILDCEGLFSPQRSKSEETYLLAFLAAVCDITILNQDLSFNRHLDELLDNLTNAIGRLTGDSLFKGTLLIALRDITQKDSAGAQEQLLQNIGAKVRKRKSSFLNTLFSDGFNIYQFSHFEHKNFPAEVEEVRERFMQFAASSQRWLTGKDLLLTIKILLIQLQTQDDENTDDVHFRFQIDSIVDKIKVNWIQLNEEIIFKFQDQEFQNKSYVFWSQGNDEKDFQQFWQSFITKISKDLKLDMSVSSHNTNLITIQDFIQVLLTQRKSFLLNLFEVETQALIKSEAETEFVRHQRTIMMRYLDEQEQLYSLCQMQCSSCYLTCSKMMNHSNLWQSQINYKDSQLQTILKKFDNMSIDLSENEQLIEITKQQEIELKLKTEELEKSIYYFQEYQKLCSIKQKVLGVQTKLKNHELSDDENHCQINFYKLLSYYQNMSLFKIKQEEQLLIEESGQDQFVSIINLQQFIEKKLQIFLVEQIELRKKNDTLKSDLEKNSERILYLNQQNPKDLEQQQILQNLIEQSNQKLEEFQKDIQAQQEKTENLSNDHQKLFKNLKFLKLLSEDKNSETNVNDLQRQEECLQQKISKLQNQNQSLKDQIINIKKKLENPEEKKQAFSLKYEEKLKQKTDEQFFKESLKLVENYNQTKQRRVELQDLEQELNNPQSKLKKNFQGEIKRLQRKFKFLEKYQFKTPEEIILQTTFQIKEVAQQLSKLNEFDVEIILEVVKCGTYNERNSGEFKIAVFNKKIEEWVQLNADEVQQQEEKLASLQNEQEKIINQINESNEQVELIKFKIQYKIELNQLKSKQDQINKEKKENKKNQDLLFKLNKKIEQSNQELMTKTQNNSQLLEDIASLAETIQIYDDKIKIIQEKNTGLEIFEGLIAYYYNLKNDLDTQINILKDWEQINKINDSLTEQGIQEIIDQQVNEFHELQELKTEIKQQIEILKIQNRDLLLIQQLQFQLDEIKKEEKEQHSCLRATHQCDQQCIVCKDTFCGKVAAHQQEHLCDQPLHYCTAYCSIKLCDKACSKLFQHDGSHTCENLHYCKQPCQFCGADCQFEQQVVHSDHFCAQRGCIQKCSLCARSCLQEHSHSRQEGPVHFCENIHSCSQKCNLPGVCVWEYLEEKREWKSSISSFEYTYFKLIDGGKQVCTVSIEPNQLVHGYNHTCKVEAHRCGAKCPECDGLCTKSYGHEGFHFAKQHRNKDSQIFTLTIGQGKEIQFGDNLEICKYQVGESSCPETCSESCTRRSRAHFHLMKCNGGEQCLGKTNKFARHQKEMYQGFEDIEFDEVQCVEFWKLQQWEHPLNEGDKLANIQGCSYFCPYCSSTNRKYCKLPAWHSFSKQYDDHEFWCKEEHQDIQFFGLDVVFVLDTTASMGSMIEDAKEMIIQIMKKAKLSAGKNIRFGIVAYRDHPPQDNSYVTKIQQLGGETQALKFLSKLKAKGGGDYPEAVLDGLQEAIKLSWNHDYDKMVFLIGDSPPHGKQYSRQSSWPEGCPCGIRESSLFNQMKFLQIQFKILALNSGLNQMIQKFREYIDLEVLEEIEGINFVTQVVSKVCRQIEMREVTYRKQ